MITRAALRNAIKTPCVFSTQGAQAAPHDEVEYRALAVPRLDVRELQQLQQPAGAVWSDCVDC